MRWRTGFILLALTIPPAVQAQVVKQALPPPERTHAVIVATAQLQPVTVLATRTAKSSHEVAHSIDVIDASDIAHQQSNDIGATLDHLPNVTLSGSPRPSGESIQIRGLSGDRVLKLVDGVRMSLAAPHMSDLFIDPGLVKKVAVQRGPASVLWGSGALGGVVNVQTVDATDLLKPGQSYGARLTSGYQSVSNGWFTSAAGYGMLTDHLDGLISVGHRDNGNVELGNGSKLPHSGYRETSFLAKTKYFLDANHFVALSHRGERLRGNAPTNPGEPSGVENPLVARKITLGTTKLEWRMQPEASTWLDLNAHISHTHTRVNETALAGGGHDTTKVGRVGLDIVNTSRFGLGVGGAHALTYGLDGFRDHARAISKAEANGNRRLLGVFMQDAISWGHWTVTPGVRFDHYHSESRLNIAPDQNKGELSSQLGVVWQARDWLAVYASYAEAFRAPSLKELYAAGFHFGANQFLANPELKPEKAANKEIGLRANWDGLLSRHDQLQFTLSVFRNDVDDFIDTIVIVQPLPNPPYVGGTTRSENVTDARLQGFETSARYRSDRWFAALSYGQTRGENRTKNQPLAAIAPHRWVLELGYTDLPWNGRITVRTTLAAAQQRVPAGGSIEPTAGYTTYDLLTSWFPVKDLRVDVGVHNLTDKAYRRHNAVIEETGRNIAASLTWTF